MEPNDKDFAEFARLGLRFRILPPTAVTAWADGIIAETDVPATWLVDLAMATDSEMMENALRLVPGDAHADLAERVRGERQRGQGRGGPGGGNGEVDQGVGHRRAAPIQHHERHGLRVGPRDRSGLAAAAPQRTAEDEAARKRLIDLRAQALQPKGDFADLARKNSQEQSTAEQGGMECIRISDDGCGIARLTSGLQGFGCFHHPLIMRAEGGRHLCTFL